MSARIRIVGVSDVSLGYGSHQIPAFMRSLTDYYEAEGIVIEPDHPERPPRHDQFPKIMIKRIVTSFHPYSIPGKVEYNLKAAREVNTLRPEILVIYCEYSLPTLLKLSYRPRFIIYYAMELVLSPFVIGLARSIAPYIDLIVYPEENRAVKDSEKCGFQEIPKVILYNCADTLSSASHIVPPQERNGRILYSGTIEKGRTFVDYFLREEMQSVPVDMFGLIGGPEKEKIKEEFSKLYGSVCYYGYINAEALADLRRFYSFSIVIWNPTNENQLYAAPNKFFESIAAGVPPITAPHPQCKLLIDRYKCGILMGDWSFDSFRSALEGALRSYGTHRYTQLVENCKRAVRAELNWEAQFAKVRRVLED